MGQSATAPARVERRQPAGVKGWLATYCVLIGLGAVRNLVFVLVNPATLFNRVTALLAAPLAGVMIVLICARKRAALKAIGTYLLFAFAANTMGLGALIAETLETHAMRWEQVFGYMTSMLGIVLWFLYFRKSKRVRYTLGANLRG